ncbi:hypothetical protein COT86_03795 [Candidatus Collierbacteria bacterium CG10_big_fil_rev_8_21_14_0_10_43_36]|uniref:Uncharacterized protein n=1 Tax=Candidatus Collierbacteria bacterium CG10_big_fil_rev_8_21_14_0_10_43_36 TaxID=1974534 RepID=A0A2H0VK36_9BACT|nr:MAG: hypothetical protein COT86_03795 [Candidatus Collierbacteria bacterium CG10_big_fil_rev_8_21_14_0_10_43_36]
MKSSKSWEEIGLSCLGVIALAFILVLFSAWVMSMVWGLIVPTIFTAAVEASLLPAALTLVQAIKLSILFWALGLTTATASSSSSSSSSSSLSGEGCATTILAVVIGIVLFAIIWAVMVAISGFIVWLVWAWVVPDVFAGAVAAGFVPAALSYWNACLLTILFSVLGLSNKRASSKSK